MSADMSFESTAYDKGFRDFTSSTYWVATMLDAHAMLDHTISDYKKGMKAAYIAGYTDGETDMEDNTFSTVQYEKAAQAGGGGGSGAGAGGPKVLKKGAAGHGGGKKRRRSSSGFFAALIEEANVQAKNHPPRWHAMQQLRWVASHGQLSLREEGRRAAQRGRHQDQALLCLPQAWPHQAPLPGASALRHAQLAR